MSCQYGVGTLLISGAGCCGAYSFPPVFSQTIVLAAAASRLQLLRFSVHYCFNWFYR